MPAFTTTSQPVNCWHCRHFFITHEPGHPYGCRAMGFKSVQLPAIAVYASSGMDCQVFAPKKGGRQREK